MAKNIYEDHDEVTEAPPERLSSGLIIVTTLVLIGAVFFMQKALGHHYNEGMFADKQASSTE